MTATLTIARNEITKQFRDDWNAKTPAINGATIIPVAYEGMPFDKPLNGPWARLTIRHTSGETATFPDQGVARFRKVGVLIVSVFQPTDLMEDTTLAEQMAAIAQGSFEGRGTPSQIEFTDVSSNEIGISTDEDAGEAWYQMNVVSSFNYDELAPV